MSKEPRLPKFAIFYNNDEVVYGGGEDDEIVWLGFSRKWLEAPSDGVVGVLTENYDLGREELFPYDYYYQLPVGGHGKGCVGSSMKIGAYLRQLCDIGGIVKFGGWTDPVNFRKKVAKLMKDNFIQNQSGKRRPHNEDTADD